MKRRGFFGALLGLAMVPFIPIKEVKAAPVLKPVAFHFDGNALYAYTHSTAAAPSWGIVYTLNSPGDIK